MRDEVQPYRRGRGALQRLTHLDQVAARLAHLVAFVPHQAGMHPGAREWLLSRERFRLRSFRLVVAELQVPAATMDVDLLAEVVHRHRGALDVPSRPTVSEFRRPCRLVGRRAAPQREVQRVGLGVGTHGAEQVFVAQLAQHREMRQVRETPVAAVLADIEVERVGAIRVSECVQLRRRREDADSAHVPAPCRRCADRRAW